MVPYKTKVIAINEMRNKLSTAVKIVDKPCLTTTISLVHVKLGNITLKRIPRIEVHNKLIIKGNIVIVKLKPLNENVCQHTMSVLVPFITIPQS